MEKNINDYLHFHLGCDVRVKEWKYKSKFIELHQDGIIVEDAFVSKIHFGNFDILLRPLSDLQKTEAAELGMLLFNGAVIGEPYQREGFWHIPYGLGLENFWTIDGKVFNQHQTIYLLSKHFDVFGLIEDGLAIDATKL